MQTIDKVQSIPSPQCSHSRSKRGGSDAQRARLIQNIVSLTKVPLRPVFPREWLNADVTMPQLRILLVLFEDGPSRMSALSSSLGVGLATATGIVDRLVERGLVDRENSVTDRRVVMCTLSTKGNALMNNLSASGLGQVVRILEAMTLAELRLVAKGTEVIINVAGRLGISPDEPK